MRESEYIKCAKSSCKWKGVESELAEKPVKLGGVSCTAHVCPVCGHDSYQFMTNRQVEKWKRDRVLHYIEWHANAYGAPAPTVDIQEVLKDRHGFDEPEVFDMLEDLKRNGKITYWEGKYNEGWIIPEKEVK